LFLLSGRTLQIREEHFKDIETVAKELVPIPLDYQKLYRLGFLRNGDAIVYRQHGTCQFFLQLLKDGRWEFYLNGDERIRIVSYVHQVQRLWFDLFDDHLFIPREIKRNNSLSIKPKSGSFLKRH
jgi:hypothetical protein